VHDSHYFTIPIPKNEAVYSSKSLISSGYEVVDRLVQGLSALFLAIRRRPVIRYQSGSEYAMRVAESLYGLTYKQVGVCESHFARGVYQSLVYITRERLPVVVTCTCGSSYLNAVGTVSLLCVLNLALSNPLLIWPRVAHALCPSDSVPLTVWRPRDDIYGF
jgi:hypothetical protein